MVPSISWRAWKAVQHIWCAHERGCTDSQAVPKHMEGQGTIEDLDAFLSQCSEIVNLKRDKEGNTKGPEGAVCNKTKVISKGLAKLDGSLLQCESGRCCWSAAEIKLNTCSRKSACYHEVQAPNANGTGVCTCIWRGHARGDKENVDLVSEVFHSPEVMLPFSSLWDKSARCS